MTNQEYMDVLKNHHTDDVRIKTRYNENSEMVIIYSVSTNAFYNKNLHEVPYVMKAHSIIEIRDGKLYMPVPNIMDRIIEGKLTASEYCNIIIGNEALMKIDGNMLPNQFTADLLYIPYYDDEAKSFQCETMGEIILYKSHKQYVDAIMKTAHEQFNQAAEKNLGTNI